VNRRTPMLFTVTALIVLTGVAVCFARAGTVTHPPSWKQASGTIDSVIVLPVCSRTTYAPIAVYSYLVHGAKYGGIGLGRRRTGCTTSDEAKATAATRYRIGQTVKVYYNPYEPTMSLMVLDTPDRGKPYWALGVLLVAVVGIAVWRAREGDS
jgi:hypothetical protein